MILKVLTDTRMLRMTPVNFVDPSGLNMAGPNTRYSSLDPMGVAYYVDGMLTTAHHAWSILGAGAGFIDFANVAGISVINSWEERLHGRIGPDGRPTEGSWIEYRNFSQTVHIWGAGPGDWGAGPGDVVSGGRNGNPRTDSTDDKKNQQRAIEACARAKIRRARRQTLKDAARSQLVLAGVGGVVLLGLLGGVPGKVGAVLGGAYLSPEVRGIGERAISPQIFRSLADCERLYPLGVLGVGTLTRLGLTTTL